MDGIFQVSDNNQFIKMGDTFGKMEVERLGDEGITMTNKDTISLSRGRMVEIMGDLKFEVADNDQRNFAPVAEMGGETKALNITVSKL